MEWLSKNAYTPPAAKKFITGSYTTPPYPYSLPKNMVHFSCGSLSKVVGRISQPGAHMEAPYFPKP